MAFAALLVPRNPPGALERVSPRFSRFAGLSVLALTVAGTAQHLIAGGTATPRSGVLLLVGVLALVATLLLSRYAVAYGRRLAFRERYMRGFPVEPSGRRPMLGGAIGVQMVLSIALLGVAVAQLAVLPVPDRPVAVPLEDQSPTTPIPTAREARRRAVTRGSFRNGSSYQEACIRPSFPSPRSAASWWSRKIPRRSAGGMGAPTSAIRTGRQ